MQEKSVETSPAGRARRPFLLVALVIACAFAGAGATLGGGGSAAAADIRSAPLNGPRALGDYFFGKTMARAEVVLSIGGAVHDYRIDRGRVRVLGPTTLELRDLLGGRQTIEVSPSATVRINGRPATLATLRQGQTVVTVRDNGGPADTVLVSGKRALADSFFGRNLARAEVVLKVGAAVHDYRLDRGRVRVLGPTQIELRDVLGTRQTIDVSPSATVRINGRTTVIAALRTGQTVLTVRDNGAPADTVLVLGKR